MTASIQERMREARNSIEYWTAIPAHQFAIEVCRLLDERRLTRAELARAVGCSRAHISDVLRGDANLQLRTMVRILKALGMELHLRAAHVGSNPRWSWSEADGENIVFAKAWGGRPVKARSVTVDVTEERIESNTSYAAAGAR